jgi:uncharacterized protein (DUF427 family)
MATAIFNGAVVADSDSVQIVDGNVYFPQTSIDCRFFRPSKKTTVCGGKGTASYYDLTVEGITNMGAAWYYAEPKLEGVAIKNHIAFWKGVTVTR